MQQWKKRRNAVMPASATVARVPRPKSTPAVVAAVATAPAAKRGKPLTIARAAEAAGVGVETVRFYEREGLIPQPPRPSSGYRIYPPHTVHRIRFIRHCQDLGFSLKETRELLRLNDEGTQGCDHACKRVDEKIRDLNSRITAMTTLRDNLESLLGHCPEGHCLIMDELNLAGGCDPGCGTCSTKH
jgi:MerR family mercuric resistance operon transcriptional regulator